MLLFFFFSLLLTDKTDAGRRDREIIYCYVVPSNISKHARERNLNKFSHWYKLSPRERERERERIRKIEFESQLSALKSVFCLFPKRAATKNQV